MKKPHVNLGAVILLSLMTTLFQSCTDGKSAVNEIPLGSEPIPVKVMQLEKSADVTLITASGQLTTEDETLLSFKTGGVVKSVSVKEGDPIRKGQLLAALDCTEIDALVAQARYGLEKEQRDFMRVTNLYADSVATLEQLQNAQTARAVAQEKLEAAEFNRTFSEIHAPANGFVLRKFVNHGRVVSIGDPILLTNAAVSGKWILKVGVSDKEWAALRINDKGIVQIDAFPQHPVEAVVMRKSETADPQTGAFTVELKLVDEKLKLATGMFGAVTLQSQVKTTSWSVPYEAVLDAHDNEGFVFVTQDKKTAMKVPVAIESFSGQSMRIRSGLENGGALIVSGSAYLTDHSPIRVVN
jgi:RND family efflux transporter MFP subunit